MIAISDLMQYDAHFMFHSAAYSVECGETGPAGPISTILPRRMPRTAKHTNTIR